MPTALVVEDDLRIARVVGMELARSGWTMMHVAHGMKAVQESEPPSIFDAMVLDLMLPDIDGLVVCRAIRERSADVPILILSARNTVQDRVAGLEAGADDYLVKPFASVELAARLRAITRRAHPEPTADDWIEVGAVRLSRFRHEVRVANVVVGLTRREFSLLEYFLSNEGLTLTRAMILERVWGWGFQGTPSIVDVYVGYLRNKIPGPDSGISLETVRGVGYVLRSDLS